MDNQNLTQYIEDYLNGVLPADERMDFEQRLETDKEFQQEVRLHKLLNGHLSDPRRWKHYDALADAIEKPASPKSGFKFFKLLGLLAVVMAAGLLYWQSTNHPAITNEQFPKEAPLNQAPESKPIESNKQEQEQQPKTQPQQPTKIIPIAASDPANFELNSAMEDNIEGVRGGDWTVNFSSPALGTNFKPNKDGKSKIEFRGTIAGAPEDASPDLELRFYNNRDGRNALKTVELKTQRDATRTLIFEQLLTFDWQPGLYYFKMMDKESRRTLKWGKFTIGKLSR